LEIWIRETRVELEDSDEDDDGPKRHQMRVVWAIGVFSYFFLQFLILTNVLLYVQVLIYIIHDRMAAMTSC
jgi:hypothetical protein